MSTIETGSRIVYRHRHIGGSAGCPGCASGRPLNLAERELITGRSLTQIDDETGVEFCVDCLADLPRSGYEALFHVCGEDPAPAPEPEPPAVHKTRTTQPAGYNEHDDGVRRFDKRGRVMYDRGSFALCSCGWVGAGATRAEARSAARAHRERADTAHRS